MNQNIILLTIPGLRPSDVSRMPNLQALCASGDQASIQHSFPCVTWPSQANVLTGKLPREHGVVANGFYWRDRREVEMWTAWNEKIDAPQIWDRLHDRDRSLTSAAWFPMLSKGSGADQVCMPAPIHNPDGSETMWCYTKPQEFYGELMESLGAFPLHHFWGPLANIKSSQWIADSAVKMAQTFRPRFNYIYLPHLDYAAQKIGPNSEEALQATTELDELIGRFSPQMSSAYQEGPLIWVVVSEYVMTEVDHVLYPNRILREAGLLKVKAEPQSEGELLDFESDAWALVDHQFSHVFVRDADPELISRVAKLFAGQEGIDEVLFGDDRRKYGMDHPRSGEVILISTSNSWQAYYWWEDDSRAPTFARNVDIHRKPGYDPVEMHLDFATRSVPLDATLIGGSHGAPPKSDAQRGALLCSQPGVFPESIVSDVDIADRLLRLVN